MPEKEKEKDTHMKRQQYSQQKLSSGTLSLFSLDRTDS
jgi:hypothetical protein